MKPIKTVEVFGERMDFIVDGAMSHGTALVIVQTSPPGGGPPPHSHSREDETFTVLEGEFEFLSDGEWIKAPVGELLFGPRGKVHAFRNVGKTDGRIAIVITPAGMEIFFEKLSGLRIPADIPRIQQLFAQYGLTLHG